MNKNPKYGIDSPLQMITFSLIGALLFFIAFLLNFYFLFRLPWFALSALLYLTSLGFFLSAILILSGSLIFKFRERDWLFENLKLSGDEKVLDLGCGHGLLIIEAAKKLTKGGIAYGMDLWQPTDRAFNSSKTIEENLKLAGVENKVKIHSGDIRKIPFEDNFFSVIISSWAIHNFRKKEDRDQILMEIVRVLKPGGKVAILDTAFAPNYVNFFFTHGFSEVQLLGPRRTFGNKTYFALAIK